MPEKSTYSLEDFNKLAGTNFTNEITPETAQKSVGEAGKYKGHLVSAGDDNVYSSGNMEDLQARFQTTGEIWSKGSKKFVSQIGTGVVGNIVNLFYGTGSMIKNQSFNKFFDNDLTQALDSWDDGMREKYQNFNTEQEQNRAWYKNMGTANFWADDFLGGMAFTISAVLSEIAMTAATAATFGATSGLQAGMTARILAKAARGVSAMNKANKAKTGISAISSARSAINIANRIDKTALFTRRLITGAGYEAGVEARGFKDEAWADMLKGIEGIDSKEQLKGSNPELYNTMEDAINSASNWVFAGNTAIVGLSNFVTLPKTFGKGLFKSNAISSALGSPTRLSGKEGARTLAFKNWNKLQKGSYYGKEILKRPLTEGLFEEGGQGFVKHTGLEYVSNKYNPEGVANSYDLIDAMHDSFGETYGSSFDNEFWKEVGIGMIIGSLGSPTFNFKSGAKGMWQGSLVGAVTDANDKINIAEKLLAVANANPGMSKLAIMQKQANLVHATNKEMYEAHNKKDFYRGKNAESQEFYNMVANRYKLGVSDQMLEETIAEVKAMPIEEFAETFGYEGNMTTEELQARKKEVIETATDNTNRAVKSIRGMEKTIQDYSFVTDAGTLNHTELIEALAYNDYMVGDLDSREMSLADKVSERLNVDARTLIAIRNENQSVRMTKQWIQNFKNQHSELKEAEAELKDAEDIEANSSEIEILRKKVNRQRSRYYRALKTEHTKRKDTVHKGKKYDRDFESFKELVESTTELQDKINQLYVDKPARAKDTENMLNDLSKMATQREAYVEDMSTLLSVDGYKVFNRELDSIREASIKDSRINLYNKLKDTVASSKDLSKEQIEKIISNIEEQSKKEEELDSPTMETPSKDEYLNTVISKVNEFNKNSNTLAEFQIFKEYLVSVKTTLEGKMANMQDTTEASQVKLIDYTNITNQVLETEKYVDGKITLLKESEKSKNYKGFNNVLNSVNSFVRFINKDEDGKEIDLGTALEGRQWQEIKSGLRIEVKKWGNTKGPSKPTNTDGSVMDTPIEIESAYINDSGSYAIRVYVGDTLIGALTSPNKFILDGKPIDLSDPQNTKLLNSKFTAEEISKLNYYKTSYENLLQSQLSGDRIGFDKISQVIDFKLFLKELKYIPKGTGRKTVKDSKYKVTLGGEEGYLILNKLGNTVFVTEDGEKTLSSKSNRQMYSDSRLILQSMSLSAAEIYSKTNHSHHLVIPRGEGDFGLIGLDYPTEQDETMSDEALTTAYSEALKDFNSWSTDKNNKNAKTQSNKISDKSIYNVPITITVTRKGSITPIGLDISLPLLRNKKKDGTWGPATMFGNAKVSGPTRNLYGLFLGLRYDENFDNLKIKINEKFSEDFTVENLKKWINKKLHESLNKSKKDEATEDLIRILTENGKHPASNVTVSNIFPKSISEFKGDLELAAEPTSPAIIVQPSTLMDEVPDDFIVKEQPVTKKAPVQPTTPSPIPTGESATMSWEIKTDTSRGIPMPHSEGVEAFLQSRGLDYLSNVAILNTSYAQQFIAKLKKEFTNPDFQTAEYHAWLGALTDEPSDSNNENGDEQFSTRSYKGDVISLDEIKALLKDILPESVKVEELSTIVNNLQANGEVFGVFMNNIIYLDANKATKGLAYHEAFHSVFRTLFTATERTEILKLAEKEFGKPTKKDRDELQNFSGKYKTYSVKKLNELWLEEKLADKFATHKPTNKSWFSRIFNKIKKWLGLSKSSDLSLIFDNIYEGKFKSRFVNKTPFNNSPAFTILKTDKNQSLSARESEILISQIYLKTLKNTSNSNVEDKILEALKEVKAQFNITKFGHNYAAGLKASRLFFALTGRGLLQNEQSILDAVTTRIGTYNFTNKTITEKEEELESNDETPERIFEEDLGNFRGIKSLSERIRNYITNTYYYSDFLGLGLTGDELKSNEWRVSVEYDKVYDALIRGLADVKPSDIMGRIYHLGQYNPQIKLFFDKLVVDIHSELGIKEEYSSSKKLDYSNSSLFRELITNFDNTKVNFMSSTFDPKRGVYRIFNTNTKDIDEQQVSSWSNLFQNIRTTSNIKETSVDITTDLFQKYYPSKGIQSIGQLFENIDENVKYIQAFLAAKVGLTLSTEYIKWSIIKDNFTSTETTTVNGHVVEESLTGLIEFYKDLGDTNINKLLELVSLYETFKDSGNSLDEDIEGQNLLFGLLPQILNGSPENANPFSSKSDEINDEGGVQSGKGAVTRFKAVARANGVFDHTISSTTFRNNGGNLITDKVKNSFYTDMYKMFKTQDFKSFFKEVKQGDKNYEDWAELLSNNNIEYTDTFNRLYFEAIKNNPLLTENIEDLFNSKQVVNIIGGLRETVFKKDGTINTLKDFKDGKDFKNLSSLDKVLFSMIAFTKQTSFEDKNYGLFTIEVNEAKNINYLLNLPVNDYTLKGGPNNKFMDNYYKLFLTEYNIIKETKKGLDVVIKGFNDSEEGRGHKFFKFDFLSDELKQGLLSEENITPELEAAVIGELRGNINTQLKEFTSLLVSEKLVDSIPLTFFNGGKRKNGIDRNEITNFVLNDFINSFSYSDLVNGSDMVGHKSLSDIVKRNGGKVAYGSSLGEGTTRISVIPDYSIEGLHGTIAEAGDGQSYSTAMWRMNTYLKGLGKYRKELDGIYDTSTGIPLSDKILIGIPLNKKEYSILSNHNVLFNSLKLVGRDAQTYWKTSVHTISRSDVSDLKPNDYENAYNIISLIKEKINEKKNDVDLTALYMDLHKLYTAKPHREGMHKMLNSMELQGKDITAFESSIKTSSIENVDMSNRFIREQVNTDGFKNEIIDGTQMMQLIWSEQSEQKSELVGLYKHFVRKRIQEGYNILENTIFEKTFDGKTGKPLYDKLFKEFKSTISSSLDDPYMSQLFELDEKGQPLYDPNYAAVVSKFESMFLSYVSKHAFKFKSKGRKYTLVANYGYKVKIDANDNVIPTDKSDKGVGSRYLKYDSNTGIAEVIISKYAVKDHLDLIKKNDGILPDSLALQLGFRIPTQDNGSIVKLKVVDLIDGAYGNTIIIPSEINEISGSDFDIDSLYAKIYNLTSSGVKFGDYKTIKSEGAAIKIALDEIKDSKYIKDIIKDVVLKNNAEFRNALTVDSQGENKLDVDGLLHDMLAKSNELLKVVNDKYSELGILNAIQFKKSTYFDAFKKQRDGDKWADTLTREELENSMLDVQMDLAFNEFATETVEREPITKVYAELLEEGIDLDDGITGVHDMTSKYKAFKANDAGKGGIGPMALFNTAYQVMRDANVKFTQEVKETIETVVGPKINKKIIPLEVFPGKSSFTKDRTDDGERINKLIASFITAYTDNNKFYDSERMGIDTNLVTSAAILFSTGVPLKDTITFFSQDSIQFWKAERNRGNWPKADETLDYLKAKAKRFGFSTQAVDTAFKSEKMFDLNSENLIKSLKLGKNGYRGSNQPLNIVIDEETGVEFDETKDVIIDKIAVSKELKAWVDINKAALGYFDNIQVVAKEIRDFSKITALLKGVKKTTANVESIVESAKKLGVTVTKTDNLFKLDKVKTSVNWFNVINKSRYIEENLVNLFKLRSKVLNQFLISYTKGGRDILDSTVKNTKEDRYSNEDTYKKMLGDFNSFLQLRAYLYKGKGKLKYDFNEDLFNTDFFDTFGKIVGETTNPDSDLYNNRLLTQIRKRHYPFGENSIYSGKVITWGEINTNSKRDADSTIELLEGFNNLLQSTNPDAKKLAGLMFKQIAVKDNFKFKNNSLIRLIELKYLKTNLLDLLPTIKSTLEKGKDEDYQELFGMSLSNLRDEFIRTYSRNVANYKEVRNVFQDDFNISSSDLNLEGFEESGKEEDFKPSSIEEALKTALVTTTKGPSGNVDAIYFNARINKNVKRNVNKLKSLGLFNTSFTPIRAGSKSVKLQLEFPRVIRVGDFLYEIQLPNNTISDIYKGYSANYKVVNPVGNSMISPYAFYLEQHDAAFSEIKMKPVDDDSLDMQAQKDLQDLQNGYAEGGFDLMAMQSLGKSIQEASDLLVKWNKEGDGVPLGDFIAKELGLDLSEDEDSELNSIKIDLDFKVTTERIEDIKALTLLSQKLLDKFKGFVKEVVITDKIEGKGMYSKGIVYLNPNKVTQDTPFHEFAHPFVAAIREDNPKLYDKLYEALKSSQQGQDIIKKINDAYSYKNEYMFKDEVIVTALGINAATIGDKGFQAYKDTFWEKLRGFLKKLFSNPFSAVIVSQIDSSTTLKELGLMMLSDNLIKRDLVQSEAGSVYPKEIAFEKVKEINRKLSRIAVIATHHSDGQYKIHSVLSKNVIEIIKELEECQ